MFNAYLVDLFILECLDHRFIYPMVGKTDWEKAFFRSIDLFPFAVFAYFLGRECSFIFGVPSFRPFSIRVQSLIKYMERCRFRFVSLHESCQIVKRRNMAYPALRPYRSSLSAFAYILIKYIDSVRAHTRRKG